MVAEKVFFFFTIYKETLALSKVGIVFSQLKFLKPSIKGSEIAFFSNLPSMLENTINCNVKWLCLADICSS